MREEELWSKGQWAQEACIMRPGAEGGQLGHGRLLMVLGRGLEGLGLLASQPLTINAYSLSLLKRSVLPGC